MYYQIGRRSSARRRLELGNQQQELGMAGKELQALVLTRDIVARAYGVTTIAAGDVGQP